MNRCFREKKILLGITGSIAAYKSAILIRHLVKEGAEVKVLMTPSAKDFITPLTLSTLSKYPVFSEFSSNVSTGKWNNHVELGLWADALVIAPATANTISKMASGNCDNFLLAVYLSAKCPVFIAPAMDLDMYKHQSTKENLKKIVSFGNIIIPPARGELASGLTGEGRMEEPEEILKLLVNFFSKELPLQGKKFLITAGPTYEPIDPVRFIGNYSSGKMGFAIAEEAAKHGAKVKLITGPVTLQLKNCSIERIDVSTADEMYDKTMQNFQSADVAVLSAAVADFKPGKKEKEKIKKQNIPPSIGLLPTKDILSGLGKIKNENQILIGFALETENEMENAKIKLRNKNLDFIVLNSLRDKGAGFKSNTNKITILDRKNKITKFELKEKSEVAVDIINQIKNLLFPQRKNGIIKQKK